MVQLPIALALSICESVVVEERTRNVSLINCFTTRLVTVFPSPPQKMAAVAFFVDGFGDIGLKMVIEHVATGDIIYEEHHQMKFSDPLQESRAVFRFGDLVFPQPGKYDVSLIAEGEFIAHHSFHVFERKGLA